MCFTAGLIREELFKKLIVIFIVFFYAATVYMIASVITPLLTDAGSYHGYSVLDVVWCAIVSAFYFPFLFRIEKKWLRVYLSVSTASHIMRVFRWLILLTVAYIFIMSYYTAYYELSTPVCVTFILTALILWTFYGVLIKESVRQMRDAAELREAQIRELQYEKSIRDMETVRRLRHDMRHLLNRLSQIAEQGDLEGVKTFLNDTGAMVSSSESRFFCKDRVLNSLLQYYVEQAEREGITCSVSVDCGEVRIPHVDLTVVFGNVMENAIRACREAEEDARIALRIGRNRGLFLMQVTNSCAVVRASGYYDLNQGFLPSEAFESTRRGGGHGLRSIAAVAEKNGGEAKFRYDMMAKEFSARVFLKESAD